MKTFQPTLAVCLLLCSFAHSWILMENTNSDEDTGPRPPKKLKSPMITLPNLRYGAEMYGEIKVDEKDPEHMYECKAAKGKADIEFDARKQFKECTSISEMERQGPCNSSWAVTAASVLTDRFCVQKMKNKPKGVPDMGTFSSYDLMTCGSERAAWDQKAKEEEVKGCRGGSLLKAWRYMETEGIVTGGAFQSGKGCKPNKIDPSGQVTQNMLVCKEQCESTHSNSSYDDEKHKVKVMLNKKDSGPEGYGLACRVEGANSLQIQLEVKNHGPVAAVMLVCKDIFEHDHSKVYERLDNSLEDCEGYAAVKIIGWGYQAERDEVTGQDVEKKFWIVRGPWGKNVGDAGIIKVLREPKKCWQNGCIEMKVSAPNFNFNKRVFYKGPYHFEDVMSGKAPKRPQDFEYIGY